MPLSKTRFVVRIADSPRILFSILEKPNGELIVPIRTAERFTDGTGPRLLEQRYSIHPSPGSPDFTTIKQTINVHEGKSVTSVILTDAIKKRSGFSLIFVRRVQNLTPDRYAIKLPLKTNERAFVLADLDPDLHTLFFGLFIGHPDSTFDASAADVFVAQFPFKECKIVILMSAFLMPAHYTSEFAHAVTLPPETAPDEVTRATLRYQMQGKSAGICVRQFRNAVKLLSKRLWEKALTEVTEPELIEFINDKIRETGDVTMTPVEEDTGPQSIHMLSDGTPLNPQSPPQPPESVQRKGQPED
jgi:hypothetical protein